MEHKVTITNGGNSQLYDAIIQKAEQSGIECKWNPIKSFSDNEELIGALKGSSGVIAGGEKYNEKVLSGLKDSLKVIARFGIGYDQVDLKAAEKYGIAVTNTPTTISTTVAEFTLGLLLSLSRNITKCDKQIRNGVWEPQLSWELYNKTVGIIGFGSIGKEFAKLLKPFNTTIYVYDIKPNKEVEKALGIQYVEMDDLLEQSDVVSLHLPLDPSTRGMFNAECFSKMKDGAVLVNTSRGGVVLEKALIDALKSGKISAAALDVFETEPINADNELLTMDNVILTPHAASYTAEGYNRTLDSCLQSIQDAVNQKRPECLLNNVVFEECQP
jgi:D-3-phosphoglycerate dehydrogenase